MSLLLCGAGNAVAAGQLASPDDNLRVTYGVKDFATAQGCPFYAVTWRGRAILTDSRLGLKLSDGSLGDGLTIVGEKTTEHDATWKPVCGERATVRDHYRQVVVDLQQTQAPHRRLQITFRAYDEGAAVCYTLPKQPGLERVTIEREGTEFRFPADWPAWVTYMAQGEYARVPVSAIRRGCERPLVLEPADDLCVAVAEARLVDYARMKFAPLKGVPQALVADLAGPVEAVLPLVTPWRVVMVAPNAGRLLENNFLILNLNDPCALADTSWIRPGKVIREVTLTTAGGRACVDFAAARHLEYVEFDAGWYGPEDDWASDATRVNVDPKRSKGPLDLQAVIDYARQRGVGIILYVNHKALEQQLDQVLPLYRRWGVKGIKFGFVNVGSQQWTRWLHDAIRKAAAHQLMVDVHDEYRVTGYSRTYPNLMTAEGIRGDETSPTNATTLAIAFTRMLAGPADNTVCYYDPRVERNACHAYQLAKPVCLFSPWQFLYWYDRPQRSPAKAGGAGGREPRIGSDPELEFYDHLPTVWDDTRVLEGRIGQYAVIARRRGPEWYVGCMNAGQSRTFNVALSFLDPTQKYIAHRYRHDSELSTRTKVRIERVPVDARTVLTMNVDETGGEAVRIVPADR
jgi:alpha-glucosidase